MGDKIPHCSRDNPDDSVVNDGSNNNEGLRSTMTLMQKFMVQKGLISDTMDEEEVRQFIIKEQQTGQTKPKENNRCRGSRPQIDKRQATGRNQMNSLAARENVSEVTVYKPAVVIAENNMNQQIDNLISKVRYGKEQTREETVLPTTSIGGVDVSSRKCSSSSDELMDTSDETMLGNNRSPMNISGQVKRTKLLLAEEQADKMVHDAEASRARMFEVPGKLCNNLNTSLNTSQIDEDYQMIDSHVDKTLICKVQSFKYVELGKLIPKNRYLREDDGQHQRLEIVNKNGTF